MKKLLLTALITGALALSACSLINPKPTLDQAKLKNMTPQQRAAAIENYNKEQAEYAANKPKWDALESAAGAVLNSPEVEKDTTHTHCNNHESKPVCHTNPDGSETCTQSGSGNCTSIGL